MKKTLFVLSLLSLGFAVSLPASAEQITLSDYNSWDEAYTVGSQQDDAYYYASGYTGEIPYSETAYSVTTSSGNYGIGLYDSSSLSLSEGETLNIENSRSTGQGIYLDDSSTFTNSGTIDIDVTSTSSDGYGISLGSYSTFTNNSGGTIDIKSSTYGVCEHSSSSFYNEGSLFTDSIYTGTSSAKGFFYLLNGSTLGASTDESTTTDKSVTISGAGNVYLGGQLSDGSVGEATGGSSTINVSSGLSISSSNTVVLNDNVTLKMGGDLSLEGGVSSWNSHSLTVDNGGTAHTITIGEVLSAKWDNALTISEADSDSVSLASTDNAVTMSDGSISATNVTITGSDDAIITLDGVSITASTLALNDVTLFVDEGKGEGVDTNLTITCNLLSGVTVNGKFTLDLSNYTDEILSNVYDTVTVTFDRVTELDAEASMVYATIGYDTATALLISGDTASFSVADLTASVPEPTTASLSLLGLGALLLRRRRV